MKKIIFAAMVIVFALSVTLLSLFPQRVIGYERPSGAASAPTEKTLAVSFSVPGGFLDGDTTLALSCPNKNAQIRYTLDGSEPTEKSRVYDKPIALKRGEGARTMGYAVRAAAYQGGERGETATATYILDENITSRFDTLVFSLTTDPYNLYDYEYGIFVGGKLRDDFLADNAEAKPNSPANFNVHGRESERPVLVEVFEPDGTRVITQNAGMRVAGGWSRAFDQKSVRLIARSEYGKGRFDYDFFPGDSASDAYGTPIAEYDSIVLRNCANDRKYGMLRDELIGSLAEDAGWDTVSPALPAAVFLNGEYYGFAWVHVTMNDKWLADKYGGNAEDYEIYEGGEAEKLLSTEPFSAFLNSDFTDPKTLAEFEKLADIDNLLTYYALQIYIGNHDWPGRNMKRWRYNGDPENAASEWQDGRWRYVLFDTEMSLGYYGHLYPYNYNNLAYVLGEPDTIGYSFPSPLLQALLKNRDILARFTQKMCAMGTVFGETAVSARIDSLWAAARNEIAHAITAHKYADNVTRDTVLSSQNEIREYAALRFDFLVDDMTRRFGLGGVLYKLTLTNGRAMGVKVSDALFFTDFDVILTPEVPPGEKFSHWIINGERVDGEIVTLHNQKSAVTAEAVFEPKTLVFENVFIGDKTNGCTLRNVSDKKISLAGLYISDKPETLTRWAMPKLTLAPGETLELVGSKHGDKDALFKVPMNFNLGRGEVLILSDADGNILAVGGATN